MGCQAWWLWNILEPVLQAGLPGHIILSDLPHDEGLPSNPRAGKSMETWHLLCSWIAGAGTNHDLYLRDLAVSMVPGGMNSVMTLVFLSSKLTPSQDLLGFLRHPRICLCITTAASLASNHRPHGDRFLLPVVFGFLPSLLHPELAGPWLWRGTFLGPHCVCVWNCPDRLLCRLRMGILLPAAREIAQWWCGRFGRLQ